MEIFFFIFIQIRLYIVKEAQGWFIDKLFENTLEEIMAIKSIIDPL